MGDASCDADWLQRQDVDIYFLQYNINININRDLLIGVACKDWYLPFGLLFFYTTYPYYLRISHPEKAFYFLSPNFFVLTGLFFCPVVSCSSG